MIKNFILYIGTGKKYVGAHKTNKKTNHDQSDVTSIINQNTYKHHQISQSLKKERHNKKGFASRHV